MNRWPSTLLLFGLPVACTESRVPPPSSSGPKIDMHMHAWTSALKDPDGKLASIPCMWPDCESRPTVVRTDQDVRDLALEAMDRHNVVLAVVTEMNLDRVYEWADAAPGRFFAGAAIGEPAQIDTAFLQEEFAAGRLQVIGEIGSQYFGIAPNDPSLEPVFALAERLGVPTLIHVEGIAGPSARFRIAQGHPELLEEVLARHPDLRLWLENAGYPFLEETIALMYRHQQVHADLSTITWIIPREEFYRYLQALMGAGLGSRLMWGSDQMGWPSTIDLAVDAIESAPFLTEEAKRDIFYNNAARFLRLDGR